MSTHKLDLNKAAIYRKTCWKKLLRRDEIHPHLNHPICFLVVAASYGGLKPAQIRNISLLIRSSRWSVPLQHASPGRRFTYETVASDLIPADIPLGARWFGVEWHAAANDKELDDVTQSWVKNLSRNNKTNTFLEPRGFLFQCFCYYFNLINPSKTLLVFSFYF